MANQSPLQAIKKHCRACYGDRDDYNSCSFSECKLHKRHPDSPSSNVKRIRAFCLTCVENYNLVRECDGKTLNMGKCSLHPFRMSKNPNRAGLGRKDAFAKPVGGNLSAHHGTNGD